MGTGILTAIFKIHIGSISYWVPFAEVCALADDRRGRLAVQLMGKPGRWTMTSNPKISGELTQMSYAVASL